MEMLELTQPGLDNASFVEIFGHFCFSPQRLHTQNDFVAVWVPSDLDLNCSVNGAELLGILRALTAKDVAVAAEKNKIRFRIGDSSVQMQSLPPEEFLFDVPDLDDAVKVPLPANSAAGLRHCLASATQDLNTPELVGVTVTLGDGRLSFDAYDRAVMAHYECEYKSDVDVTFILPAEGVKAVLALQRATSGGARLYVVSDEQVVFEFGDEGPKACRMMCLLHAAEPFPFKKRVADALEGVEFADVDADLREKVAAAAVQVKHNDGARAYLVVDKKAARIVVRDARGSECGTYELATDLVGAEGEYRIDPEALSRYLDVAESIGISDRACVLFRAEQEGDAELIAICAHGVADQAASETEEEAPADD